ncbi:MAG: homocysteine S-methyltransferase family protein [Saprospiraceae bacterium]|nr:homocysteine S-methyltransferase family protein [Saprospiraceae bacterium]
MMTKAALDAWLAARQLALLDGAMGTELERRGYRTALPLWSAMANIEVPRLVHAIHVDYLHAGADLITANTFRTTAYTFTKTGQEDLAAHCTRLAVELAHEAISQARPGALLCASVAPLEDCYRPDLVPSDGVIEDAYDQQLDVLASTDVDVILAETMINRTEALTLARLLARRKLPFMMSFTTDGSDRMLDGTPLEDIIAGVMEYGPSALLINCRPAEHMDAAVRLLKEHVTVPFGVYANGGGSPDPETGWKLADHSVEAYSAAAVHWHGSGAKLIGGCCGTTPEIIAAVNTKLKPGPSSPGVTDR